MGSAAPLDPKYTALLISVLISVLRASLRRKLERMSELLPTVGYAFQKSLDEIPTAAGPVLGLVCPWAKSRLTRLKPGALIVVGIVLAKRDPYFLEVIVRHLRHRPFYDV